MGDVYEALYANYSYHADLKYTHAMGVVNHIVEAHRKNETFPLGVLDVGCSQ